MGVIGTIVLLISLALLAAATLVIVDTAHLVRDGSKTRPLAPGREPEPPPSDNEVDGRQL